MQCLPVQFYQFHAQKEHTHTDYLLERRADSFSLQIQLNAHHSFGYNLVIMLSFPWKTSRMETIESKIYNDRRRSRERMLILQQARQSIVRIR